MDRSPSQPGPVVAAALPLVIRHDAGDVEAPPVDYRIWPVRAVRPLLPHLPDALPCAPPADGAGGRRLLGIRPVVPQPAAGHRLLALVPAAPEPGRRVRALAGRRALPVAMGAARSADRLPAADVPSHHSFRDHGPARNSAALAGHPASGSVRRRAWFPDRPASPVNRGAAAHAICVMHRGLPARWM